MKTKLTPICNLEEGDLIWYAEREFSVLAVIQDDDERDFVVAQEVSDNNHYQAMTIYGVSFQRLVSSTKFAHRLERGEVFVLADDADGPRYVCRAAAGPEVVVAYLTDTTYLSGDRIPCNSKVIVVGRLMVVEETEL